ncbi:hypothetical protein [Rhodohalobacter halophilus]|uniref:hypothetical protein n=1 Tax=Rhodohalobacter halophilus TaxID=1812810 RepID=UPI00083F893D|nr:hypothetical protein [Rhodohalobacter halophilus]
MKTILTSISLLLLSILLVIGCEVLEDSIEKQEEVTIEQSTEISDGSDTHIEAVLSDTETPSIRKEEREKQEEKDS